MPPKPSPPPARELSGLPRALRQDVRLLGELLGRVIAEHRGEAFVDRIETIRALAKRARAGRAADWERLSAALAELPEDTLTDIARAFNQFLNLANIADQRQAARQTTWPSRIEVDALSDVRVELVLTAHPTEVLRRTLIQKYDAVAALLEALTRAPREERPAVQEQLERVIAEAWHTDEIRHERPSPADESRWGFAVIESSLWEAVPAAMRDLDRCHGGILPPDVMPFAFASWMGGDRDGNPSVTASVTREVRLLARWMAADLFLRDVTTLSAALSMSACTPALRDRAGDAPEPYRAVLRVLRDRLLATRSWAERGGPPGPDTILDEAELREPLKLCYESLSAVGLQRIADGPLLDTLRRTHCFGVHLVDIDVRQHAERHTEVFDELTRYLYPDRPADQLFHVVRGSAARLAARATRQSATAVPGRLARRRGSEGGGRDMRGDRRIRQRGNLRLCRLDGVRAQRCARRRPAAERSPRAALRCRSCLSSRRSRISIWPEPPSTSCCLLVGTATMSARTVTGCR